MGKDEKADIVSTDDLIRDYKAKLKDKIDSGETKNISSEIATLVEVERKQEQENEETEKAPVDNTEGEEEVGIPSKLRIPRRYNMSDAAKKQRKERQSKGGKARAKKCPTPNWRHGLYATSSVTAIKPCKTTCKKYPCELIAENSVKPGETCLDMVFVLQTFKAINNAVKNKKYDEFNEIAAFSISQSVEILRMCQEDIIRDGTMIKVEKFNGFGRVIGYDYKPHPSLLVVPKLIAELGMTPQETMITARQIAKDGNEKELPQSLAGLLSSIPDLKKPQ